MLKTVSGELVATGTVAYDGAHNGAEPAAMYDYVRIEDERGQDIFLERVIVPAALDSHLGLGTTGKFYLVEVRVPTLFGSKPMYFAYGIEVNGRRVHKAIAQTQRCLRSAKGGAIRLFGWGCILLVAWGFGLLLWVQACRLLSISLPLAAMEDESA